MKSRRGNRKFPSVARRLTSSSVLVTVLIVAGILVYSMVYRFVINPPVDAHRADANSPTKVENVIQITVKNECGVKDVAMDFTNFLRRRGFDVVETENGKEFNRKFTTVVNTGGDFENALRVAEALGVERKHVVTDLDPHSYVDVEVLIGKDYENLKPRMGIE